MTSTRTPPPVPAALLALATPAWAVGLLTTAFLLGLVLGEMVSGVRRFVTSGAPSDLHAPAVLLLSALALTGLVTGFGLLVRQARRAGAPGARLATVVASLTGGGVAALGAMLITFVVLNEIGLLGFIEPAEHEVDGIWLLVPAITVYIGVAVAASVAALVRRGPGPRPARAHII